MDQFSHHLLKDKEFGLLADSRDPTWPCVCQLSPKLRSIENDVSRSQLIRFNLIPPHTHTQTFLALCLYAVFTPLTIEWWAAGSAVAPNRRLVPSLAGSRSDRVCRVGWLFSAIVIYFGSQPEPAENHYPHCHVFRLTVWNTPAGHTYRTSQILAHSRQTQSTASKGEMCSLPMSHTASNYQ